MPLNFYSLMLIPITSLILRSTNAHLLHFFGPTPIPIFDPLLCWSPLGPRANTFRVFSDICPLFPSPIAGLLRIETRPLSPLLLHEIPSPALANFLNIVSTFYSI